MTARKKRKKTLALYVGRSRWFSGIYEIARSADSFDVDYGFKNKHVLATVCSSYFNRYVGKLRVGEVRRLHVRLGKKVM